MVKSLRDLRRQRGELESTEGGGDDDLLLDDDELARSGVVRVEVDALPMLICSDHHLGEHGKDLNRIDYVKRISDQDLCAWLEHYGTHRIAGKPWRLVINGDFVDFLAVTFTPEAGESAFELTDHESQFGLDNSAPRVVWKLEHIYERHKKSFTYLAEFVARGNHLDMLYGNHDIEFYWPEVQARFVELLIEAYFGGERVDGATPDDFRQRVRFHEWFLHVPGRIYIEHGNQYDDFCSFDHVMKPLCPFDRTQIAEPIAHLIIRYFVNQYTGFRSHGKDNWTILDYVTWLRGEGWANFVKIVLLYGNLFSQTWGYARKIHETVVSTADVAEHDGLVEDEGHRYGMSTAMVREVNEVRMRPIESTIGSIIQVTALDKYLLGLSVGSITLFVLAFGAFADMIGEPGASLLTSNGFRLLTLLMIGVFGYFLYKATDTLTARFVGRRLSTSVAPKLDRAAERLARVLDVSHIVMGHTHRPLQRKVQRGPDVTYTNTGAWIPAMRREDDQLTFAIYDWDREHVTLYEWDTRELRPRAFAGGGRIEHHGHKNGAGRRPSALEVDQAELMAALEKFSPPPPPGDPEAAGKRRRGLRRKKREREAATTSE